MMRYLAVFLLAFFSATISLADTYTFNVGYSAISNPAGSVTIDGAGLASGSPAGTNDKYIVPDDANVAAYHRLAFSGCSTGANICGFEVQSGGTLVVSSVGSVLGATGRAMALTSDYGHDTPEAGTILYGATGSTVKIQGGYLQVGVHTPLLVPKRGPGSHTTWVVDTIGVCAGTAGSLGDCTSGTQDREIDLYFTDVRNNYAVDVGTPCDYASPPCSDSIQGSRGETYLDEAITNVNDTYDDDMLCFFDDDNTDAYRPGEAGFCYPIIDIATSTPYHLTIDVTQPGAQAEAGTAGYPRTRREIVAGIIDGTAHYKGETCVKVSTDIIVTDGTYNGRAVRFCDNASANCDEKPYRISWTYADKDCAGSAASGKSAIFFEEPLRRDIASDADLSIDYMIAPGDTAFIMRPVRFDDNSAAETDGRIDLRGTVEFSAVVLDGHAEILFDGATIHKLEDVIVVDSGQSGAGVIQFENINSNIAGNFISMSGGDSASGGHLPITFNNITGDVCLSDVSIRHNGGHAITHLNLNDSHSFSANRVIVEYVGDAATQSGIIDDDNDRFSSITLHDSACIDCTSIYAGGGAVIKGHTTNRTNVSRLLVLGSNGCISTGAKVNLEDVLVRRNITACTSAGSLGQHLERFDIQDYTVSSGASHLTVFDGIYRRGILNRVTLSGQDMLRFGQGATYTDLLIIDPTSTGSCAGGACEMFSGEFDDDTSTVDQIAHITITNSTGATHTFASFLDQETGMDADAAGTKIGAILIANTAGTFTGTARGGGFSVTESGYIDFSDGPWCFFNNSATGSWQDVLSSNNYNWHLETGNRPGFKNTAAGDYHLAYGSWPLKTGCGAREGSYRPGPDGSKLGFIYSLAGLTPPTTRTIGNARGL